MPKGYALYSSNQGWFRKNHIPWNKGKCCPSIPGNPHPIGQWRKGIDWADARSKREAHTQALKKLVERLTTDRVPFIILDSYTKEKDDSRKIPDLVYIQDGKLYAVEAETISSNKASAISYEARYKDLYAKRHVHLHFIAVQKEV